MDRSHRFGFKLIGRASIPAIRLKSRSERKMDHDRSAQALENRGASTDNEAWLVSVDRVAGRIADGAFQGGIYDDMLYSRASPAPFDRVSYRSGMRRRKKTASQS